MTEPLDWTLELARAAGARLLDWFGNVTAERKADGTLVTEADTDVDEFITEQLRAQFPADDIVSEELNTIYSGKGSATWIIDPLDATTNFKNGLPLWGVSIARLMNGQPNLGVMYFPLLDEMYHAARGQGAFLNHQLLTVRRAVALQPGDLFVCCARTLRRYDINLRGKLRVLGCASYDLCTIAAGKSQIVMQTTPKVWDLAAAWLLVEEAGGVIETLDGGQPFPLTPEHDYAGTSFPTLAAATPELLATARAGILLK